MNSRRRFSWAILAATCAVACGCTEQVPEPTVPAGLVTAGETKGGRAGTGASEMALVEACNVEHIDGGGPAARVRSAGPLLRLDGWVAGKIDSSGKLIGPATVELTLREGSQPGKPFKFTATETSGRDDVALAFAQPGLANAGFQVDADISRLPEGLYVAVLKRGEFTCDNAFELQKL